MFILSDCVVRKNIVLFAFEAIQNKPNAIKEKYIGILN